MLYLILNGCLSDNSWLFFPLSLPVSMGTCPEIALGRGQHWRGGGADETMGSQLREKAIVYYILPRIFQRM